MRVKSEKTDDDGQTQATAATLPDLPNLPVELDINKNIDVEKIESPPKKKSALDQLLGDVYIQKVEVLPKKTPHEIVTIEMNNYKKVSAVGLGTNPLSWWKENEIYYPYLSKLAKLYLGIPATSVPSERIFSTAGDILSAKRATLKPDVVDMTIFLKKNMYR